MPPDSAAALRETLRRNDAVGALTAWEQLRADSFWLSGSLLWQLLHVCNRAGKWRCAHDVLVASEAKPPDGGGMAIDVGKWNVVLQGCVRAGELREAEALLDDLTAAASEGSSRAANAESFNALMRGYLPAWAGGEGEEARVRRAEALLARMVAAGVAPDAATYAALVGLHWINAPRVSELMAQAEASCVKLEVRTYARASRALWWALQPEPAWGIIGTMRRAGVEPDAEFYATAIAAAESVSCFDDADRLHREAIKTNLGDAVADQLVRFHKRPNNGRRPGAR